MANVGEHVHVRDERKGACERGRKGAEKSENQYDCQAAERSHEPWTNGPPLWASISSHVDRHTSSHPASQPTCVEGRKVSSA